MGRARHDTVRFPGLAHHFDCTPDQLLDRLPEFKRIYKPL